MDQAAANLAIVQSYLTAIEAGDAERVGSLCAEELTQVEWPNRFKPKGDRRGVARMKEDLLRSKGIISSQRYEIENSVAAGDAVAVQVLWTGTLAVPIGTLKAGDTMSAHSGIFFRLRDGRIVEQFNYDCLDEY